MFSLTSKKALPVVRDIRPPIASQRPAAYEPESAGTAPSYCQSTRNAIDECDATAIAMGLQNVELGILVLDRNARLRFANGAGQRAIDLGESLFVDKAGFLRSTDSSMQQHLRFGSSYRSAANDKSQKTTGFELLAIPRRDGLPLVALIGRSQTVGAGPGPTRGEDDRTVIFIRDPERIQDKTSERVAHLFGLSQAEAHIVSRMVLGESLDGIAEGRGVSLSTIRNQVKSAQSKIGVSKQAGLVSLVLRAVQF